MSYSISDSGIVVAAARTERAMAVDTIRDFIDALGRRDFAVTNARIAPGFRITMPGNHTFRTLEEFAAFSRTRNGGIHKSVETIDACEGASGIAVFAHGHMHGTWPDGGAFADVRFIDRFTVVDGQIADMEVWNDLAEFRPR